MCGVVRFLSLNLYVSRATTAETLMKKNYHLIKYLYSLLATILVNEQLRL